MMLRYKRWTFEAWYQSELHLYTILSTMVSSIPLGNLEIKALDNLCMLVFLFHHLKPTTSIHHTSMYIDILKLVPCKKTYEMHIQMYHTSSWACSPYLCAQDFNWSPSFVISYLSTLFLPLSLIFVSLPLCHQWPQRLKV